MSEYPCFEIESLANRCTQDITEYKTNPDTKCIDNTQFTLLTTVNSTFPNMQSQIKKIIDGMTKLIPPNYTVDTENVDKIPYYIDILPKLEINNQNQLWLYRTYLFYQIMIFACIIFNNETLFKKAFEDELNALRNRNSVIKDDSKTEATFSKIYNAISYPDRITFGIFGSKNPTSDIDVGIQYSGPDLSYVGISAIVLRCEQLFIIFTGTSSLHFDIEIYADLMTISRSTSTDKHKTEEHFYLDFQIMDSSKFTSHILSSDMFSIIPYICKEINRNMALAYHHLIHGKYPTTYENMVSTLYPNIKDSTPLTLQSIFEFIMREFETIKPTDLKLPSNYINFKNILEQIDTNLSGILKLQSDDIFKFLKYDYRTQSIIYFNAALKAEESRVELLKDLKNKKLMIDTFKKISDALNYRMESYVGPSTVMHVVRILQSNKYSKDITTKYKTRMVKECPIEKEISPFCMIGYNGFIISALEQLGYLNRFVLTYCNRTNSHYESTKCSKKVNKYLERFNDAIDYINGYIDNITNPTPHTPRSGGKYNKSSFNKSKSAKPSSKKQSNKKASKKQSSKKIGNSSYSKKGKKQSNKKVGKKSSKKNNKKN